MSRTHASWRAVRPPRNLALLLATTALVTPFLSATASAQDWTGAVDSSWNVAGNWNPAAVPTSADIVTIDVSPIVLVQSGVSAQAGGIFIGETGTAALALTPGGTMTIGSYANVGDQAGSSGTVSVGGIGAFLNTQFLTVGNFGTGEFIVGNFGNVIAFQTTYVGSLGGGVGTLDVRDLGSSFSTSILIVADIGAGELIVSQGASASADYVGVGLNSGGSGTVSLRNSGSKLGADDLEVGVEGEGEMTISDGAIADVNDLTIGVSGNGSGEVTVTGTDSSSIPSSLTVGGFLIVGESGSASGKLTIENGATVLAGGALRVGQSMGTDGSIYVTGGATFQGNLDLSVGTQGTGHFEVNSGGQVNITSFVYVGEDAGGDGSLVVDGAGSKLDATGAIFVGNDGTGQMTVSNGGQVTASNLTTIIGTNSGSEGHLVVRDAGSRVDLGAGLNVGNRGLGTLAISNGGEVAVAGNLVVGSDPSGTGEVSVSGGATAPSRLSVGGGAAIGNQGAGSLTIADGGVVDITGTALVGTQTGATGALNIGAAAGMAPQAAGSFSATSVLFAFGAGEVNFNHTDANYVFATPLIGNGTVNQRAGVTRLTGNSGAFSGSTIVSGGTLVVDGALGGTLDVLSSGRLQGTGTIGSLAAAGTIAPGNSIGTLNVAGNVAFAAGSVYQVEVDPNGQSDRIVAGGAATINGGTVEVMRGAGSYAASTQYTVLTAAGGLTGTFSGVTSSLAFLDPTLSYDAGNAYLILTRNDVGFANVGFTPNQIASGAGVEGLGAGNPIYAAALGLSETQARAAFDRLSGEAYASAKGMLIEDSHFLRDAMVGRLRAAFGSAGASSTPVMAYGEDGRHAMAPDTDRFAAWGQGFGSWAGSRGDGNAAGIDRSTGGVLFGADALVFDSWRMGLVGGYSQASFDIADRFSSGSSDNYHLGIYGGTEWGNFALRTGFAYTWHDLSVSRSVAFPGFANSLTSDYSAGTAQAFGEFGYRARAGRLDFEPFANLAHVRLTSGGFVETGGAAGLTGARDTTDVTFTTLGLRGSTDVSLGGVDATVRGMVGWRHAFDDPTPLSTAAFAGSNPFTVAGIAIARDSALVEAGFDINIGAASTFGLSYSGQFAKGRTDQSLRLDYNLKF